MKKEKTLQVIKPSNDVALTKTYDLGKPAQVVEMAKVLKTYIVKQELYSTIKEKNYAHVDGWQFAGFLTGIHALIDEPKNLSTDKEIKWSVCAKLYQGEKVVGVGYALCSNKESKKKDFDEYAILSMAQTRSIGKAYRNKIGWVMKLAGYQSTPSEEMHKVNETPHSPSSEAPTGQILKKEPPKKGQVIGPDGLPTYVCSKCDDPISDEVANFSLIMYGKRLCKEDQPKGK